MPSFRGYRPDRKEEILAKVRERNRKANRKKWLKKQNNYKISDSPLDNRV